MARWWVSEPYINLWISDTPLKYQMASGQPMSFRFLYKQRFRLPARDEMPSLYLYNRLDAYAQNMRSYGMTNAGWGHNWMMDILFWDAYWDGLTPAQRLTTSKYYWQYDALVFTAEGAILNFGTNRIGTPVPAMKRSAAQASAPTAIRLERTWGSFALGRLKSNTGSEASYLQKSATNSEGCATRLNCESEEDAINRTGDPFLKSTHYWRFFARGFLASMDVECDPCSSVAVQTRPSDARGQTPRLLRSGF